MRHISISVPSFHCDDKCDCAIVDRATVDRVTVDCATVDRVTVVDFGISSAYFYYESALSFQSFDSLYFGFCDVGRGTKLTSLET